MHTLCQKKKDGPVPSQHQTDPSEHRISFVIVFTAKFPWAALSSSHEQPLPSAMVCRHGMCRLCTLSTCYEQRSSPRTHWAWSPMFGTPRTDGHQSNLDKTHDCRLNSCRKKFFQNSFYWLDELIKYSSKSSFFPHRCTYIVISLVEKYIYIFFKSLKFTLYL